MEEENPLEAKEKLDELSEHRSGWTRYLAITTAVVAVLAALASMRSGNLANSAMLEKNDAILAQTKASDQWSYYQAKGIKKALAEGFAGANGRGNAASARYGEELGEIEIKARGLEREAERDNVGSEAFLGRHEKAATSVTMLQIAIALSAMAALMRQKWFWYLSLATSALGAALLLSSMG